MSTEKLNIDWGKFLTVDDQLLIKTLNEFESQSKDNFNITIYTVKYESQEYRSEEFIQLIKNSILKYVLDEGTIEAQERNEINPLETAMEYFGKIDPAKDGKLGELILYLLVESILKVPLIAFKMTSSMKDQAKGSDGIFCGNYKGQDAILLGESKAWSDFGAALGDAFKSIHRFHGADKDVFLKQEYVVASASNRFHKKGVTKEELDHIYDCLTFSGKINQKMSIVHPILIIYDKAAISSIDKGSDEEMELSLSNLLQGEIESHIKKIEFKLNKTDYSELNKIELEFFMIPVESVEKFRNDIFLSIHGTTWIEYKEDQKKKAT